MTRGTSADLQYASEGLEISASRGLPEFLTDRGVSVVLSACRAGKLVFIGVQEDGRLSVFERSVPRCTGLATSATSLYVASQYQVWRFESLNQHAATYCGYDRVFAPRVSWVTGDLDIHDLALGRAAKPLFANTLFSCVSATSEEASFTPVWRPPFISRLAAEDRCHLNGLAMREGAPAYVTVIARSDVADGWRDLRKHGGLLIDIESGETALANLSMPHSPRVYRGETYLNNAGTGEFGRADLQRGVFEPIAFCPGYARGMAFTGGYAFVTMSLPRVDGAFRGLDLDDRLNARGAEPRCGLLIVDMQSGDAVQWLRIEGAITELFDVAVLEGTRRPAAIGFKTDEIRRVLEIGDSPLAQ